MALAMLTASSCSWSLYHGCASCVHVGLLGFDGHDEEADDGAFS